jgi:hypothetical protein
MDFLFFSYTKKKKTGKKKIGYYALTMANVGAVH